MIPQQVNGGASDRYSITDGSGNGYGPRLDNTALYVERRDLYSGTAINNVSHSIDKTSWYTIKFRKFRK